MKHSDYLFSTKRTLILLTIITFLFTPSMLRAQNQGIVDTSFHFQANLVQVHPVMSSAYIEAFAYHDLNNQAIIGGDFSGYNDANFNYTKGSILRINCSDGTIDQTFNTGGELLKNVNHGCLIKHIEIEYDTVTWDVKSYIVGGEFSLFDTWEPDSNGIGGLAKFDAVTGQMQNLFSSTWRTFLNNNIGYATDQVYVQKVKLVGNKLYVAVNRQDIPQGTLARLNYDSQTGVLSLDPSFSVNVGESIRDFEIETNGTLLVALEQDFATDAPIVRLTNSGAIDPSFDMSSVISTTMFSGINVIRLYDQANGNKILLGGNIRDLNGVSHFLMRVLNDGTVDTSFNETISSPAIDVKLISNQQKILVCGGFAFPSPQVAILNDDGSADPVFVTNVNPGFTFVRGGFVGSDKNIYILGGFSDYNNNTTIKNMAKLYGYNYIIPTLCVVTVDENTGKNMLVWDKPVTNNIDSYHVYKEIAGVYQDIATVPYNNLSEYIDVSSDPMVQSDNYKLSAIDINFFESVQSAYVKSIHLQQGVGTLGNNLNWNAPEGFAFSYYNVLRMDSNGVFNVIDTVNPGNNTYTDTPAPSGTSYYIIQAVAPNTCVSTFRLSSTDSVSASSSNTLSAYFSDIEEKQSHIANLTLSPNPTSGNIVMNFDMYKPNKVHMEIKNMIGASVYKEELMCSSMDNRITIDMSNYSNGLYSVNMFDENGSLLATNKIAKMN